MNLFCTYCPPRPPPQKKKKNHKNHTHTHTHTKQNTHIHTHTHTKKKKKTTTNIQQQKTLFICLFFLLFFFILFFYISRHRAATSVLRNCCPNCYAEQSHEENVRSSAVGKQPKQKKSNFQAQHHLPALDIVLSGLTSRSSTTSLLLISLGSAKVESSSPPSS